MKLFNNTALYLLAAGLLAFAAAPGVALADGPICAAVYPCDDEGELRPEFEDPNDECGYALQCKRVRQAARKSCASASEELNRLQEEMENRKTRYTKLQRKFNKLKKTR